MTVFFANSTTEAAVLYPVLVCRLRARLGFRYQVLVWAHPAPRLTGPIYCKCLQCISVPLSLQKHTDLGIGGARIICDQRRLAWLHRIPHPSFLQ